MVKFDWKSFFDDHSLHYVTTGAHVAKGNLCIKCPFCDDRSEHMGVSLTSPSWGCWRCRSAGNYPARLIQALLGCTRQWADQIIALHNEPNPDEFDTLLDAPSAPAPALAALAALPQGCRPLWGAQRSAEPFLRYLATPVREGGRGFGDDCEEVARRYELHYAMTGEAAWRVVIPVKDEAQLWAWTARSIYATPLLRYKTSEGSALKYLIGNIPLLAQEQEEDKALVIVEGPFDMIKLDFYGHRFGVNSTCTFGTAWTEAQLKPLLTWGRRYSLVCVLYDQGAYMQSAALAEDLSIFLRKEVHALPMRGGKDPGDMNVREVEALCEYIHG